MKYKNKKSSHLELKTANTQNSKQVKKQNEQKQ